MSQDGLETRPGLPDALRVLLAQLPAHGWRTHPGFEGVASLWLGMHMHLRDSLFRLREDGQAFLDGGMDAQTWASRLARSGGAFVQHLHHHHSIEDQHYFPRLKTRDLRLERGFEILDRDHQALDGGLQAFVTDANTALRAFGTPFLRTDVGRFHDGLLRFERRLDRHLTDEEELVVPVILHYGEADLGHA